MASNHFRKLFSVKSCVWLHMENRISGNAFHLTVKIKALTRKSFYVSIFTSNHFQTQMCKERERERERETVSLHRLSSSLKTYTPSIHPRWVSFSPIHPLFHSDPPKIELVLDPPKTELVRRAMPKAPTSRPFQLRRPLHFFVFKLNPKPKKPIP